MQTINVDGRDYQFPDSWEQNAMVIFARKYCRKIDDDRYENSSEQVFRRLISFWELDAEGLHWDLTNQVAAPNSPQFFNAGIYKTYGVKGDNIQLSNIYGIPINSTFERPQLHACFIQPVEDSLAGIVTLLGNEARLFSRGSGTGTNFSTLRKKGAPLSNGGHSSGVVSFLKVYDAMAGTIKSGGTTRRAAKMVVLDCDHPDVLEFIWWKVREDDKARILSENGYGGTDGSWQSEAIQTVSGQNSNNSVRITDKFMKNLQAGRQPEFQIWDAMCRAAHKCADPGVQFADTINKWNTTPHLGEIRASNPCAEHLRLDNSACNLASINLCKFLTERNAFDVHTFSSCVYRWVRVLDKTIDLAGYPSEDIASITRECRDIGLGYANLGALLLEMGVPYDSDEGRAIAAAITSLMTASAYRESTRLTTQGTHREPYPGYSKPLHMRVLNMHREAHEDLMHEFNDKRSWSSERVENTFRAIANLASSEWACANERVDIRGLRNAQLTVIAPTGTIGLTMGCETTGIEPLFAINTKKEMAGGGYMTSTSYAFINAVNGLDKNRYSDKDKKEIIKHGKRTGSVVGSPIKQDDLSLFATAVDPANYISPLAHVKMLAAVQPFVSGGISKTVNLPSTATVTDINDVYMEAFKSGVKCISVYRNGCKNQPLSADCKSCGDDDACEIIN